MTFVEVTAGRLPYNDFLPLVTLVTESCHYLIIVEKDASSDGIELNLGHVDGREHVLEHGGHQLDLTFLTGEAIHDQERMILELLLICDLSF